MFAFLPELFDSAGFMPRASGPQWTPALMWVHIGGDLFIWLAYLSIPLILIYFTRRRELPFPGLFLLFALFILACGIGHFIEALMFQYPLYRLAGVWKVVTATVSWITVFALIPVVPKVMVLLSQSSSKPGSGPNSFTDSTLHRLAHAPKSEQTQNYIIAVLAGVLVVLLRAAADPLISTIPGYFLSLLLVVFVSWQGGFGPAIVTLILSMCGLIFFFISNNRSFVIEGFDNQFAAAMFFFCGVCCAALGEAQRRARKGTMAALAIALDQKTELEIEVALRRQAEENIRESEGRFRSMADSVPALVWLSDLDRRRTYFNKTWLAFTGRTMEQERGDGWIENIAPEDRERYMTAYTDALVAREPFELEYRLRRADGEYRWVLARGTPRFTPSGTFAGFVGFCVDVTDRKKAEHAVQRSEKNLSDFFENANVGLHWVGKDGTILRANQAELEMMGYEREEYVGRHIADFHVDREVIEDILTRLGRGEIVDSVPARLRRKDGAIRDVLISSSVLWEDGEFIHTRCFTRDITPLKQAERDLRASEERFRTMAQTVPSILWTAAPDGRITWVNDRWLAYCGITPEQNAVDWPELILHPDDHDRCVRKWANALATGTEYEIEVRNRRHDGVYRWFITRAVPVRDENGTITAWFGATTDIDDRKRGEDLLRASVDRFHTLTEAVPQMVWTANPAGEITFFNRRWDDYTNLHPSASRKTDWAALVHPDDAAEVRAEWQAAVAKQSERFTDEFRLRRASDGAYRWMLSTAVSLKNERGTVAEWVGSLTDIDDQKQYATNLERLVSERTAALVAEIEERKRVEDEVRAVATELVRSNNELEQFAYIASHDLQEPLRKIQAFGNRLTTRFRESLPDGGKEYVDRMQTSAGRMRRLIDDLLSYSRVTTQARPFVRVDLNKIVEEVLSDLSERIEPVGGEVRVGPLPTIDADPTQMRQLFQNLIANAVKFQRPGVPPVVEISAELAEPLPESDNPSPIYHLLIRDNGIGFDEKYLDRIFQVFQRLHGREEYEGTGVGLAICRKIAERHHGRITAQSHVGEGATFIVALPAHPSQQPGNAPVSLVSGRTREDSSHDVGTQQESHHDPGG